MSQNIAVSETNTPVLVLTSTSKKILLIRIMIFERCSIFFVEQTWINKMCECPISDAMLITKGTNHYDQNVRCDC